MMRHLLAALVMIVSTGSAIAQDSDADIARAYFEAYSRLDSDRMSQLLAEDAVFSDRGSFAIEGGPYHFEGRARIVDAIDQFRDDYGLREIAYDLVMAHEASGQAVYAGQVEARWARPDGSHTVWRGNVVTSVRVVDGKVIEHLDMPDYANGQSFVEPNMESPDGAP